MGNRAVTALLSGATTTRPAGVAQVDLPVQALRKTSEFASKSVANVAQETQLVQIRLRLAAYHDVKPARDPNFQRRLRALNSLDHAIHAWFSTHVTGHINQTPNGPYLQELLASSEREHRRLIAGVKGKPNVLPIDTRGMTKEQIDETRALWQSIVTGQGNIRIASRLFDGGFNGRMLAAVAKLLQTPSGAGLLKEINAMGGGDRKQRVEIGPTFEKELKALGKQDPDDSQAVPKTAGQDVTSMAFSRQQDLPDDAVVVDYGGPADAPSFNKFLTTLKPDVTHFRFTGVIYKVGVGTGSYVKMAGKGEIHANIGESNGQNREILVPEFITLGHELAHSLRMRKGTSVPFGHNLDELGFAGGDVDRKLWNNAEEYINIAGPENALRSEHGMAPRRYHAAELAAADNQFVRGRAEKLISNLGAEQRHNHEYQALFNIYKQMYVLKTDEERTALLNSPQLRNAIQDLEAVLNSDGLAPVAASPQQTRQG